jgi:hypothetical protein
MITGATMHPEDTSRNRLPPVWRNVYRILLLPSPAIMAIELGVDILELIIDQVAAHEQQDWETRTKPDVRDTLRSCALTCSAMRARAHHHLFAFVRITDCKEAESILQAIQGRPELAWCVKTLVVNPGPPRPGMAWMFSPSPVSLVSLLPLFTGLSKLAFNTISFADFPTNGTPLQDLTRSIPPSVRQVIFSTCTFWDDSVLLDIVRSITDLHNLGVKYCDWINGSSPVPQSPLISPTILTINALFGSSSMSRSWIDALSYCSLTQVEFNMPTHDDIAAWQAVLSEAPLLRSVTILDLEAQSTSLDFSNQRQLETIRVAAGQMWDYVNPANSKDPIAPVCALLSTIRSSHLSLVEITLDSTMDRQLDLIDWPNVKHVVEGTTWATAPKMVIALTNNRKYEATMQEQARAISNKCIDIEVNWLHVDIRVVGF